MSLKRIFITLGIIALCLFALFIYLGFKVQNNENTLSMSEGPGTALVNVDYYYNFTCEGCKSLAPTLETLVRANPDIRFTYHVVPVNSGESKLMARAVLAAAQFDKYKLAYNHLMDKTGTFTEKDIPPLADHLRVGQQDFTNAMRSFDVASTLVQNLMKAERLNIDKAPYFVINDQPYNYDTNIPSREELQNHLNSLK